MFKRTFLIFVLLIVLPIAGVANPEGPLPDKGETQAKTAVSEIAKDPAVIPTEEIVTEEIEGGDFGEVLFFPDLSKRPDADKHQVVVGQEVPVCIKLTTEGSTFLEQMQKKLLGFRLIMEDDSTPPKALVISEGHRLRKMLPDSNGCLMGHYKIPKNITGGTYQVADLLLLSQDQSYYSIRNYLYSFGVAEELEIKNDLGDKKSPELQEISGYGHVVKRVQMAFGRVRYMLEQVLRFKDDISGIDKKSLRVYYRILLDDVPVNIVPARCRFTRPNGRVYCKINFSVPQRAWGMQDVTLKLDSIYLKDKSDNQFVLEDPETLGEIAKGNPIQFQFKPLKEWRVTKDGYIKRERVMD